MEAAGDGRRVTRQASKHKNLPVVQAGESPVPKTKRKRDYTSSNAKQARRSRLSNKTNHNETLVTQSGTGSVDIKQGSWSSGFSLSDDEDLPTAVLSSPAKDNLKPTFKKHDIVWIKYRREEYRPCLITSIVKDKVRFKFIYGNRSHTYRTRLHKVIGFDDPDKNIELLNIGRKINPHIVDAYERARLYFCRLSEQKDLSPMKYLFLDKTEDLLYGIVPEHEVARREGIGEEEKEVKMEEYESDCPVSSSEENGGESDVEDKESSDKFKEDNDHLCNDIYERMTAEEKGALLDNLKKILEAIASEDCYIYLKQIVEKCTESFRMTLFNDQKELDLQMKSGGFGPFYGAEVSETDKLFKIIDNYLEKMQFQGDSSLLARHVLIPEAIIFSLQREWKWSKSQAETFFMDWTTKIPTWNVKEDENQESRT